MIYQKLTTGMGQCLLLIRKHADRDGFELWRRKENGAGVILIMSGLNILKNFLICVEN